MLKNKKKSSGQEQTQAVQTDQSVLIGRGTVGENSVLLTPVESSVELPAAVSDMQVYAQDEATPHHTALVEMHRQYIEVVKYFSEHFLVEPGYWPEWRCVAEMRRLEQKFINKNHKLEHFYQKLDYIAPYKEYVEQYRESFFAGCHSVVPYVLCRQCAHEIITDPFFLEGDAALQDRVADLGVVETFFAQYIPSDVPLPTSILDLVILRLYFFYSVFYRFMQLQPGLASFEYFKDRIAFKDNACFFFLPVFSSLPPSPIKQIEADLLSKINEAAHHTLIHDPLVPYDKLKKTMVSSEEDIILLLEEVVRTQTRDSSHARDLRLQATFLLSLAEPDIMRACQKRLMALNLNLFNIDATSPHTNVLQNPVSAIQHMAFLLWIPDGYNALQKAIRFAFSPEGLEMMTTSEALKILEKLQLGDFQVCACFAFQIVPLYQYVDEVKRDLRRLKEKIPLAQLKALSRYFTSRGTYIKKEGMVLKKQVADALTKKSLRKENTEDLIDNIDIFLQGLEGSLTIVSQYKELKDSLSTTNAEVRRLVAKNDRDGTMTLHALIQKNQEFLILKKQELEQRVASSVSKVLATATTSKAAATTPSPKLLLGQPEGVSREKTQVFITACCSYLRQLSRRISPSEANFAQPVSFAVIHNQQQKILSARGQLPYLQKCLADMLASSSYWITSASGERGTSDCKTFLETIKQITETNVAKKQSAAWTRLNEAISEYKQAEAENFQLAAALIREYGQCVETTKKILSDAGVKKNEVLSLLPGEEWQQRAKENSRLHAALSNNAFEIWVLLRLMHDHEGRFGKEGLTLAFVNLEGARCQLSLDSVLRETARQAITPEVPPSSDQNSGPRVENTSIPVVRNTVTIAYDSTPLSPPVMSHQATEQAEVHRKMEHCSIVQEYNQCVRDYLTWFVGAEKKLLALSSEVEALTPDGACFFSAGYSDGLRDQLYTLQQVLLLQKTAVMGLIERLNSSKTLSPIQHDLQAFVGTLQICAKRFKADLGTIDTCIAHLVRIDQQRSAMSLQGDKTSVEVVESHPLCPQASGLTDEQDLLAQYLVLMLEYTRSVAQLSAERETLSQLATQLARDNARLAKPLSQVIERVLADGDSAFSQQHAKIDAVEVAIIKTWDSKADVREQLSRALAGDPATLESWITSIDPWSVPGEDSPIVASLKAKRIPPPTYYVVVSPPMVVQDAQSASGPCGCNYSGSFFRDVPLPTLTTTPWVILPALSR